MVAPRGGVHGFIWGHAWFYLGGVHGFIWGAWFYSGGVHGFIWGGVCGFIWGRSMHGFIWGACVVLFGGCAWFFSFFRYNEIRSMSGRYASYWNAFLFSDI